MDNVPLNRVDQAVLAAYQREAEQIGKRSPLILTKFDLEAKTGYSASRCCTARAKLIHLRMLKKLGWNSPMRVELL